MSALEGTGRFAQAIEAYERFAGRSPRHAEAARALLLGTRLRFFTGMPINTEHLFRQLGETHRLELATLFAALAEDALDSGRNERAFEYARFAHWMAVRFPAVAIRALAAKAAAQHAQGRPAEALNIWRHLIARWPTESSRLKSAFSNRDALNRCRAHRAACAVAEAEIGLGDAHVQRAIRIMGQAKRSTPPNLHLAERALIEWQHAEMHYANTRRLHAAECPDQAVRAAEKAGRMWRLASETFTALFPPAPVALSLPICPDPFFSAIQRAYRACVVIGAEAKVHPQVVARCEAWLEEHPSWMGFSPGTRLGDLLASPTRVPTRALPWPSTRSDARGSNRIMSPGGSTTVEPF